MLDVNILSTSSDIRIFKTLDIMFRYISGQELDHSDTYNFYTKRNILAAIGFNLF